jgi:outer membrane protein assembly factor BamA
MVDLGQDAFGMQLGITTQGSDVVGQHAYSLRLGFGLVRGNLQVDANYTYQRSPLAVSVSGFRYLNLAGGLNVGGVDRTWVQDQYGGVLDLSYVFPRSFRYDAISLSYAGTYTSRAEPWNYDLDPNTPPPQVPYLGYYSTLRFAWTYSDVERYLYDISPSNGRSISLGVALADPLLGSSYRVVTMTWSITQFIPLWEHHVLALRYGGGISGGDLDQRGVFGVGGFPNVAPIAGLYTPNTLGGVVLRGYPTNSRYGTQMHLVQAEYRFPIVRFNQGILTLPVFLNRMYASVFADYGDAFNDTFDLRRFRIGVGAEVLIDFTLFYVVGLTLRVGYARGLSDGGIDQVYGNLGTPF